jgi:hypothetical protein
MNKFGPRCLLTDTVCQDEKNSTCENGGQCIPNDGYLTLYEKFICVCPEGFSGDRCQTADNKLTLSFNKDIVVSQHIFMHFLSIIRDTELLRSTTFRTISVKQDPLTIYWSQPFHLVFIELLNKHYYLTVRQKTYNQSAPIEKMIHPTDRCPHISELFNQTFLQWHLLRRIKYYHLPCQRESLNLSCFHDDVHLCLCYTFGQKRLANCFHFDHNMTFDCYGQSECENNGQCFQDSPDCPQRSICMCQPCFYGRRCQFSTSGFGLSLDAIIGYHIRPNVSLTHQSAIVKFSFALTIIFIVAGLINGMFCLITFKNKSVREVGCGLYLFGSSITTLLIMVMFGLKFFILLLSQMAIISNRSFLEIQCRSLDFILRVCICMDQWLNACVALERSMTVMKATRFNKTKSIQAAKFVIIILLIIIAGSCIHDPIHRRLIDEGNNGVYNEDDQKRTWCIVTYPHSFQVYNSFMHTFHFCGPFLINLISTIILIAKKSRQQSNIHKQRPYNELLREQFRKHKHLLTAPIVLIILALPRLIIASVSKCMKSSDDAWLFIMGYFISFVPPMLTFIIFIVPSDFYKKEFEKSVVQLRTTIQQRLHLKSYL